MSDGSVVTNNHLFASFEEACKSIEEDISFHCHTSVTKTVEERKKIEQTLNMCDSTTYHVCEDAGHEFVISIMQVVSD